MRKFGPVMAPRRLQDRRAQFAQLARDLRPNERLDRRPGHTIPRRALPDRRRVAWARRIRGVRAPMALAKDQGRRQERSQPEQDKTPVHHRPLALPSTILAPNRSLLQVLFAYLLRSARTS